jgi:hypothetical protein
MIAIVCRGLHGESSYKYVHTFEALLLDSDSSAGNNPAKSPSHDQKRIQNNKYSEVAIENGCRIKFPSFHYRQGQQLKRSGPIL